MLQKIFQSGSDFFGLTQSNSSEYRKNLFTQIHNIVFHGNGGYDWHTVYNMPIWLRKFTFNEINQYNILQNKKAKESQNKNKGSKTVIGTDGKVKNPNFNNRTSYK